MSMLHRKLLRGASATRGPLIAITLVLASGIAVFVMSRGTLSALETAKAAYDRSARLPRVFARVERAPRAILTRLRELDGVGAVEARLTAEATASVPGLPEPATLRLVSLPDRGRPELGLLALREGHWPKDEAVDEALVSESFARENGLHPDATLGLVLRGRRLELRVCGIAIAPEYLYIIRPGDFVPDDRRYGVLWVREKVLESPLDLAGAFNEVVLDLVAAADERRVVGEVDRVLSPFGGLGAHGRDEQTSHRYVVNELRQLRGMAAIAPSIFLAVAAILVQIVFARLVATERSQIATLKAFGYGRGTIAGHYLLLAAAVALSGLVLGLAGGTWLGIHLTGVYERYFRFPAIDFRLDPTTLGLAAGIAFASTALAALGAVFRAARLPAAEAMRPEAPPVFRSAGPRVGSALRGLPPATRMVLRRLRRRPLRAALTTLGVALGVAVLVLGSFTADAVVVLVENRFEAANRYDVAVTFDAERPDRALADLRRLPGVLAAEPFLGAPVRVAFGSRSRRLDVLGLTPDGELTRVVDRDGRAERLPEQGVLASRKLAEALRFGPGDEVTLGFLDLGADPVAVTVAGVVDDLGDAALWMRRNRLAELRDRDLAVSGAFLEVDPAARPEFVRTLAETRGIRTTSFRDAMLASFRATLDETVERMRLFNVLFATLIAFGVVFNAARIALTEQARDLTTLRVLGFTRHEVTAILHGEMAILVVLGIPIGLLLGQAFAAWATSALETETQSFPYVVSPATLGTAALTTVASALVAALVVKRRVDRFDLVQVLKGQE